MKKKPQAPPAAISHRRYYFPFVFTLIMGLAIVVAAVWFQVKRGGSLSWSGPGQVFVFGVIIIALSLLIFRWARKEMRREEKKAEWLTTLPRIPKLRSGKLPPAEKFRIYDLERATLIGRLPRVHVQLLIDSYDAWGVGQNDFLLLDETIEALAKRGTEPELLSFLRTALGKRGSVEIRWTSDPEPEGVSS
jgi:hypothetical protein